MAEALALPVDDGHELLGERVDDGHSDTVQSPGDLVAVLIELAARVEVREAHLQCGLPLGMVHGRRDAPSVVVDGD